MSGTYCSPTTPPVVATGPLTDAEKTDARRFCGYSVYGAGNSGFNSQRFNTAYGVLEFKLTYLSDTELVVLRTYLTQLGPLELGILGAAGNLDTDVAVTWTRNRSEVRDREKLYDGWRKRLCGFIGIPPGPEFGTSDAGRIIM